LGVDATIVVRLAAAAFATVFTVAVTRGKVEDYVQGRRRMMRLPSTCPC
jgi:hypothetical protein